MSFKDWALTPPMGWNSWDCFGTSIDEETLLANAQFMAENLKEYGWQYVVCDIQWYQPTARGLNYKFFAELDMDEYSRLIPAVNRFPSSAGGKGFKPIADKIHAMGLKFGIHIMRGIPRQAVHRNTPTVTQGVTARDIAQSFSLCLWNTDMYGINCNAHGAQEYYDSIIELYASWGVDFIKCDDIANTEFKPHDPYSAEKEIEMLRKAIDKCGRNIVLSLSPGPAPIEKAEHLSEHANMWRMTGDFWDDWDKLYAMFKRCESWQPYVKPGTWPDCDMIPIGTLDHHSQNGKRLTNFTHDEQITLMTLWSIFRSPLILGCHLPDCDEETLKLFTNKDVIELNQTATASRKQFENSNVICWTAENKKHRYTAVFNVGNYEIEFCGSLEKLCLEGKNTTELWTKAKAETAGGKLICQIPAHGAKLFRE